MNFVKQNIFNYVSTIGLMAVNMFVSILEARLLGPEGIGRFQLFISTQTIIATVLALGIGNAGIYFINSKRTTKRVFVSTAIKIEVLLGGISYIVSAAIFYFNSGYFGHLYYWTLLVFCLGSSCTLISSSLRPVLLAEFKVLKLQIVQYITSISTLLIIGVYYLSGNKVDVEMILIIHGCTALFGAVYLLCLLWKDIHWKVKLNFSLVFDILKFGIPFSCSNIAAILIANIPLYAISFILPDSLKSVGYYSRAVTILTLAISVNKAVGPLLYAKFSGNGPIEKIKNTRLSATFFLLVNICGTIGICVFANLLIYLLYGKAFMDSVPIVRLLCLSLVFTGMNELIYNLFSSIGKPKYVFFNLILSVLLMIPLQYGLINLWGLRGAALATVFVSIMATLLLVRDLRKHINVTFSDFFSLSPKRIKECIIVFYKGIKG